MILVILESPGKIKKVQNILGSGYLVTATVGHCIDLPPKELGIDIKKNFDANLVVLEDKQHIVNKILSLAKKSKQIILMTDPDREGTGIASNIQDYLIKNGISVPISRIKTNEITESGIKSAINNPGHVEQSVVDAYLCRRLLDRLAGFKTSYLTQSATGGRSAGRVQSAMLRILVDREKEILSFIPEEYWVLTAHLLNSKNCDYDAILTDKIKVSNEQQAKEIYNKIIGSSPFVSSVDIKQVNVNPYAPFTTIPMQATASTLLGWSGSKTMKVAQMLYQAGLCLHPDEMLVSPNGEIHTIENMEKFVGKGVIGVDEKLKTSNVVVKDFQKIRYTGELYNIRSRDGQEISVTPDHKLMCWTGKELKWQEAKNIKEQTHLVCCKNIKCNRIESSPTIWHLISKMPDCVLSKILVKLNDKKLSNNIIQNYKHLVSEPTKYKYIKNSKFPIKWLFFGDWEKHCDKIEFVQWATSSSKPECFSTEDFCYFLGLCMGDGHIADAKVIFPKCIMSDLQWHELLSRMNQDREIHSQHSVGFRGQVLRNLCIFYANLNVDDCSYKCDKIDIHHLITSLPRKNVLYFLSGLFDSDGCINIKHNLHVSYTTISQKMAKKMNILLRCLGYMSSVHRRKGDENNVSVILLRNCAWKFLNEICEFLLIKKSFVQSILVNQNNENFTQNDNLPIIDLVECLRQERGLTKEFISQFIWNNSNSYWNYLRILPGRNRPSYIPPYIVLKLGDLLNSDLLKDIGNGDVYMTPVKSITKKPFDGYVYDISTSTENFVVNTFYSHNCTYHRTDSPFMSEDFVNITRNFISHTYGSSYLPATKNVYSAKKGSQEGHECCRVTDINNISPHLSSDEDALYKLIWKRTVASQMNPGVDERIKAVTDIGGYDFISNGNRVVFDGHRKVWDVGKGKENLLPQLKKGEKCKLKSIDLQQKFTTPPPRYSTASLGKKCEDAQIARPATFSNFIDVLLNRKYIQKNGNSFQPTELGMKVTDFLVNADFCFVDLHFTAEMESLLDEIQNNSKTKIDVLTDFWTRLKNDIEKGKSVKKSVEVTKFKCPKCNGALLQKHSKYGAFLACENYKSSKKKDDKSCSYTAKLGEDGEVVEKVSKKQEYLEFVCEKCGGKMVKRSSKFGDFAGCENYSKLGCKSVADLDGNFKELKPKKWKQWKKKNEDS